MGKTDRHAKIIEIVNRNEIETQEDLQAYLLKEGIKVTQATVSRDIRELRLTKISSTEGRQKYAVMKEKQEEINDKYLKALQAGLISMDTAMNILVIKTVSGMAMAVAAAIDAMNWSEVAGCIAGDDTIMCAIRSVEQTWVVVEKINRILEK